MNCPRCHAPNENDAKFCKQCGMGMYINPANWRDPVRESNQVINYLMALLGIETLFGLLWLALQKVLIPYVFKNIGIAEIKVYKVTGWVTDLLMVGALIAFVAIIQNSRVRLFLVLLLIVRIILMVGNRVFSGY